MQDLEVKLAPFSWRMLRQNETETNVHYPNQFTTKRPLAMESMNFESRFSFSCNAKRMPLILPLRRCKYISHRCNLLPKYSEIVPLRPWRSEQVILYSTHGGQTAALNLMDIFWYFGFYCLSPGKFLHKLKCGCIFFFASI